jgi:hypothetical protein
MDDACQERVRMRSGGADASACAVWSRLFLMSCSADPVGAF